MIQDIAPHKFNNEYRPQKPDERSFILIYQDRNVLVKDAGDGITFPRFLDLEKQDKTIYERAVYLFTIDQDRFYMIQGLKAEDKAPYSWESIRIFRTANPQHMGFAEIVGHQLYNWYENHRFCGKCGRPMSHDEKERMLYCSECSIMEYPKISPAVIVGVIKDEEILMSKYAGRDYTNYALLAGFVEVGETVEETVRREVMEEVGLNVKDITYYKSQPWPVTDSLLLGFFAKLDGDDKITLDEEELAMADWFKRDEITVKRDNISLTNEMMMVFKEGIII